MRGVLSGVFSEGSKRGLAPHRMAELLSFNPARRYGLLSKGDIAVGCDADLVVLDEQLQVRGVIRAGQEL